jgi:sec-independent protein translocase protein TatB
MFNIGPLEFAVLALVALVVMGPERLPKLARDAARMIRTLRELANGASQQLREELGPEFADVDLRNLNPRTALSRAVLGDTDPNDLNPASYFKDLLNDEPEKPKTSSPGAVNSTSPKPPAPAPFDPDAT